MKKKTPIEETSDRTPGDKGKGSRTVHPESDVAKQIERTHRFNDKGDKK